MGDRGGFFGLIDKALDLGIAARRSFSVNDLDGKRVTTPVPLIAAPQALVVVAPGTPLTALGPEISVDGFTRISLWLALTWGAMTGIRTACYGRHTSGGTNYSLPIYNPSVTVAPYSILMDVEEVVLAQNADYTIVLTWDVANTISFVQFGIAATADPGADASVTSAYVTYGWGS